DGPRVEQRGGAAGRGGAHAEEELPHRPRGEVRALVVEEDHLVRRIWRGAVHLLARRLGRQVSILGEELSCNCARDALELRRSGEPEAAEQNRAVLVE